MHGNERCRVGMGIEADDGVVGDEAMGPPTAQAQFLAVLSTNKSGTRQVSYGLTEFPFIVAHDHNDTFGKRCCIISARAAVEVAHISGFILQQSRVEVAEAVDFQSP